MRLPEQLRHRLEGYFSTAIDGVSPVSGGCISQAAVLALASKKRFFLKWNGSAPVEMFLAEGAGLRALRSAEALVIPDVIAISEHRPSAQDPAYIVLELLEATPERSEQSAVYLGEGLAKMHHVTERSYGFSGDNFIGSLPQRNPWTPTWGDFFFESRLLAQAAIARDLEWLPEESFKSLHDKRQKIVDALEAHDPKPALLHGDLWSGNVFWSNRGPSLIDPAVYFGCREADIAMTECFSRFDEAFYQAYDAVYPRAAGYRERREILNLYHQFTHANMFGGGYRTSVCEGIRAL